MALTEDVENNSEYVNFRDCRPGMSSMSVMSNSTRADSQYGNNGAK
jgi:hypothetical protein